MTVIITGSNGYLGSNIYQNIKSKYGLILPTRRDLYDERFWKDLPNDDFKVIHTAAVTGWRTVKEYEDNLIMLKVLVSFCRKRNCSILFFSSIHDAGVTPYALDKLSQIEFLVKSDINYFVIRLSHVLGGSINRRSNYFVNHFIDAYIANLVPKTINNSTFNFVKLEDVLKEVELYLSDEMTTDKALISGKISASKIWDIISNSQTKDRDKVYAYLLSKI